MSKAPAMMPSAMPVADILDRLSERRGREAAELTALMAEVTGAEPVVWAGKIIGFGQYRYRYASGHEGIAPLAAFAPTPRHQTVYLVGGFADRYPELLAALPLDPEATRGAPRASAACLYLTNLAAIDMDVLRSLVDHSTREARGLDVS